MVAGVHVCVYVCVVVLLYMLWHVIGICYVVVKLLLHYYWFQ